MGIPTNIAARASQVIHDIRAPIGTAPGDRVAADSQIGRMTDVSPDADVPTACAFASGSYCCAWRLTGARTAAIVAAMRIRLLAPALAAVAMSTAPATAAEPGNACARFIVGTANSTAYDDGGLPARGFARGDTCTTLKRIARNMQGGRIPIPQGSAYHARPPKFGRAFKIYDRKTWMCRIQNRGASGPSYAVRCTRPGASLRWTAG